MRHFVVSFAFTICLAACSTPPIAVQDPGHGPVRVGEEFTLTVGDSTLVADTNQLLFFESVVEDSRCATGVQCIWEGNARVKFFVTEPTDQGGGKTTVSAMAFQLNTSGRFEQRTVIEGGVLVLRGLSPQPPITDPKTYAATLFIEPAK